MRRRADRFETVFSQIEHGSKVNDNESTKDTGLVYTLPDYSCCDQLSSATYYWQGLPFITHLKRPIRQDCAVISSSKELERKHEPSQ
jgi:hypothetical protein